MSDYAPARIRDLFLDSLDRRDRAAAAELAHHLVNCGNPLPSTTCVELGLPVGSTYGVGAKVVLDCHPRR